MAYRASLEKFGDWAKAAIVLRALGTDLTPAFVAQIQEDGEFVLSTLKYHILAQDLNWHPLSSNTRKREGQLGNNHVYFDTGFMYDNLRVLKVNSRSNGASFFVGANRDVNYNRETSLGRESVPLRDVLVWLEYGTSNMPARPLFRPTWEEVKPVLIEHWKELVKALTAEAGIKNYEDMLIRERRL